MNWQSVSTHDTAHLQKLLLTIFLMSFPTNALAKKTFLIHFRRILNSHTQGVCFPPLVGSTFILPSLFYIHSETRSGGLRLSLRQKENKHPVHLRQGMCRRNGRKENVEKGGAGSISDPMGKLHQYLTSIYMVSHRSIVAQIGCTLWHTHQNKWLEFVFWINCHFAEYGVLDKQPVVRRDTGLTN